MTTCPRCKLTTPVEHKTESDCVNTLMFRVRMSPRDREKIQRLEVKCAEQAATIHSLRKQLWNQRDRKQMSTGARLSRIEERIEEIFDVLGDVLPRRAA